ncbi:MAG: hypothetical protein ACJ8BW_07800 [Ktedonobacteraceae bacterium]
MLRATTSSAILCPAHWLIGRRLGYSQAEAIVWQVCSTVICEGRPDRRYPSSARSPIRLLVRPLASRSSACVRNAPYRRSRPTLGQSGCYSAHEQMLG